MRAWRASRGFVAPAEHLGQSSMWRGLTTSTSGRTQSFAASQPGPRIAAITAIRSPYFTSSAAEITSRWASAAGVAISATW